MLKIASVVGTRPNFIKISPLVNEIKRHRDVKHILIHTGQHYDKQMSKSFFDELGIPKPDINLGVGSAHDAVQTARIILELEKVLSREKPDLVIVVGDVNSTFAAAITAKKCGIPVAHVESGLRSFDMGMPEEINRILTDHISDFLFTTEESGNENLLKEGVDKRKIFFVGNVMIDTLLHHRKKAEKSAILSKLRLKKNEYFVLTLHRPSNVDDQKSLERTLGILEPLLQKIKIVFPVHPRTLKSLKRYNLLSRISSKKNMVLTGPLGYLDFLHLMANAKLVITDSGGIQEETTVLGVPCITLRKNTERPVTCKQGTNVLVSAEKNEVVDAASRIISGQKPTARIPKFWDGKAAGRIVKTLLQAKGRQV
ncbi:UDP-N-acetylglucosamine 2-epimerase (non-hydrolyzing) [Candidatus Woesearchaeota archaeon]|nr:UDP-N-acetylglucosamine 2-epimerase (non-hydrolyzing) [Candidatus Woesearchaeota archaeon]